MAAAAVVGAGAMADIDGPPACFLESAGCKAALMVLPRSLGCACVCIHASDFTESRAQGGWSGCIWRHLWPCVKEAVCDVALVSVCMRTPSQLSAFTGQSTPQKRTNMIPPAQTNCALHASIVHDV